ncbi:FMN-binding negative transcriptional regulator [Pectobacteriaceae bacterium C52]|nr:FMN-binding negative transcriptional regulator [Pectobacteriaceae bacterium C52]
MLTAPCVSAFTSLIAPRKLARRNSNIIISGENLIETHLASGNPQLTSLDSQVCLLNVLGPHAFISTSHYLVRPAVPTWNYASVSLKGISTLMAPHDLSLSLDKMLAFFQPELMQDKEMLPDEFRKKLMLVITGIKIEVTEMKGKLKLGQHRNQADQLNVFKQLAGSHEENALYAHFAQQWLKKFRPSVLDGAAS